jgi:hypothetical protein
MKTFLLCALVLAAPRAYAVCSNDTDCGATCGGMVCSFAGTPTCVAASTGDPGWCTGNAGCQCPGATCNPTTHYCTYTTPHDLGMAPAMDLAQPADLASVPSDDLGPSGDLATSGDLAAAALRDGSHPANDLQPDLSVTTPPKNDSGSCSFGGLAGAAPLPLLVPLVLLLRRRRR